MNTEEVQGIIMGFLEMEDTEPQDAISAVGQCLLTLLLATCSYNKYSEDVVNSTLSFVDKIKQTLLDDINKNAPDGEQYLTMQELKEQAEKMAAKLNADEADKKSRVSACRQVMETDSLGFLLLSYLKNGNVSMCSNLHDEKMADRVIAILRETLFGGEEPKFKRIQ